MRVVFVKSIEFITQYVNLSHGFLVDASQEALHLKFKQIEYIM